VSQGWRLDADDMLRIPEAPGLGLSLEMDVVAKDRRGKRLL
jgi:L-alanine-DL-glutamate epimerase-like enolase superfamily enzyme